ncbi:MAG: hypothetical protein ABL962_16960 [Fimbriimonadaceae bacterium]
MKWLVTGYGPFESVVENVTGLVAPKLGHRFEILEVAYEVVDEFIAGLEPDSFDAWLALGHAKDATKIRVETLGRNVIGSRPDVRQQGRLNSAIRDDGPPSVVSTLWAAMERFENDQIVFTDDAGGYLCNYILYRAVEAFPDKHVGFLHLPPQDVISVDDQVAAIHSLMHLAEGLSTKKAG